MDLIETEKTRAPGRSSPSGRRYDSALPHFEVLRKAAGAL